MVKISLDQFHRELWYRIKRDGIPREVTLRGRSLGIWIPRDGNEDLYQAIKEEIDQVEDP